MGAPNGPRARYQADVNSAVEKGIPNVVNISKIEGDGEFVFSYSHALLQSPQLLEIQMVPQEYASYPSGHFFLAFACNSDVPSTMSKPLDDFTATSMGMQVPEALTVLSRNLTAAIERGSANASIDGEDAVMTDVDDADGDGGFAEFGSDDEGEDFEDFEYDDDDIFGLGNNDARTHTIDLGKEITPEILDRIRRDFRSVRNSGFKLGRICGFDKPTQYSIVSISARVDTLCLSDETRQAWNIDLHDFIVLLVKFDGAYTTFEDAIDRPAENSNLNFRLRKCSKYRPSIQQAVKAFSSRSVVKPGLPKDNPVDAGLPSNDDESDLSLLSIGESIDTFMFKDFVPLLKLRKIHGCSWDGARKAYASLAKTTHMSEQNHQTDVKDDMESRRTIAEKDSENGNDHAKLPAFIAQDHLVSGKEISLPVVAAQFAMRYLIRCTDYCMVCHQRVDGNFEALKPYVCGDPLCLFQYMSLGFGPSIDHEIMNQPNVVDLLISFCYAGLQKRAQTFVKGRGLREYPTGLNLQVPNILLPQQVATDLATMDLPETQLEINGAVLLNPMAVQFDWNRSIVEMNKESDLGKIREGMWVAVVSPFGSAASVVHHGRIELIIGRSVTLCIASRHTLPPSAETDESALRPTENGAVLANMVLYDRSLDDLDDQGKAYSLTLLLAAMPSVESMRTYLAASSGRRLDKWDRLTPSASKLLRWIVASNRSYIVQVDGCSAEGDANLARDKERISGVNGWIQFRFAQGSPEKEMRFREEVNKVKKPQKTILAWHGSDIGNWHSIIRQGLDFKEVINGRAYGDGVYFGRDFNTSLGYSGRQYAPVGTASSYWPNSALKITGAVSLNEIVNKTDQYRCVNSFCLVVQHVHWIQCRYLFVKPTVDKGDTPPATTAKQTEVRLDAEFVQDPAYAATGPDLTNLFVPLVAIPTAQGDACEKPALSMLKYATGHSGHSDDEDAEDMEFLFPDDEDGAMTPKAQVQLDKTDFRPGTLDLATLPKLNPPSYATDRAQRTIGKEINKLQKVQSTVPLHELGWYIDFESITNMFHWIVELHSFDASLPLAKDMKKAGLTSIVLEFRFGRDFPLSPPFVRVIRPRFLPFLSGGGGHVTAGGAMCMELLTNSGWSPVSSLESVLLQVRMAMCSAEPAARLESTSRANRMDYGIGEAFDAYTRAASTHGWVVPEDLREATTAMMEAQPSASASS